MLLDPAGGNHPQLINGIRDVIIVYGDGTQQALGVGGYLDIGLLDTMEVEITDEEIQQRISELTGEEYPHFTGYLGIYQKGCISISKGAVLR